MGAEEWQTLLGEFGTEEVVREGAADEHLMAEDATIGSLAAALRGDKACSVAEAFLEFAPALVGFSAYTSGIDQARSRIDAIKKLESGSATLQRCQEHPDTKNVDIYNWMMRPSQHIMRQPMLLEQLHAMTAEGAPAKPLLEAALNRIKAVVSEVDEKKYEHEQRLKLNDIFPRLQGEGSDHFLEPHRHLVRGGGFAELKKAATLPQGVGEASAGSDDDSGGRSSSFTRAFRTSSRRPTKYAILTNDTIWYCELLRGNRYRLLHVFDLASADFRVIGSHGDPPAALWIADEAMAVQLQPATRAGNTSGEASIWLGAITETHEKLLAKVAASAQQDALTAGEATEPGLAAYIGDYRRRFATQAGSPTKM